MHVVLHVCLMHVWCVCAHACVVCVHVMCVGLVCVVCVLCLCMSDVCGVCVYGVHVCCV